MVTSTPLTTSQNGARAEDGRDQQSPLDRSRAKANHAQQALAEAGRRVDDIDERLERNSAQGTADEKALAAAQNEVRRLKKALKDGEKERQKLVFARKRAIADVEKAGDKARKAEAKYDREVLADLIEREKEHDRAAPSATPAALSGGQAVDGESPPALVNSAEPVSGTGPATTPADDVQPSADGPVGGPAVEPEDLATATARTTAARATADSAGEEAQPAPEPPRPRRSTSRSRATRSASSAASATESGDETASSAEA